MTAQVAGFILRALDRERTALFYQALGLHAHEHEHEGPLHFELGPTDPACVAEVYRRSDNFPTDALMVKVLSLDTALSNIHATPNIREVGDMRLAYVTDPDGRSVMVYEIVQTEVCDAKGLAGQKCLPCGGGIPPLSRDEIENLIGDLDWWILSNGALEKTFCFKNFKEANAFVRKLEPIAEKEDHHPDIHIEKYKEVKIVLITHAIKALSINDFILAAKIDEIVK
ncbi:MAG: hypothetical protein RLZZ480_909 [Candidatus Parcubacteria bacterium]|jgi:4a-hydroxytetrahydrobiopterin dehydratase